MSWLSSLTGIGISPHGIKIDPWKAVGTALTVGSMGGLGPVAGALSHIPGVAKVGGALAGALHAGTSSGDGVPNLNPEDAYKMIGITPGNGDPGMSMGGSDASGGGGGFLQGVENFLRGQGGQSGSGSGGSGSGSGGILGSLEGLLTGNGGMNVLGAAQGVNAALQQKKANDYANSAMKSVQDSYDSRAPLRTAGIAGLLKPATPSIAGLSSIASTGNPYATGSPNGVMSPNQQMQPRLTPVGA